MIHPLESSDSIFEIKKKLEKKIEGQPTTYKIIRLCLENFEKEIYSLNLMPHEAIDYNSCVQSALVIHKMILTTSQNIFFENCLLHPVTVEVDRVSSYRFLDLFTGSALSQIFSNSQMATYFECLKKQATAHAENILSLAKPSQQGLDDLLNKINQIDFNLDTFLKFKTELLSPTPIDKDGLFFTACSRFSQNLESRHFYHVFSIEKYQNTRKEYRYRVYEAMVGEYSLLESFIYRGYRQGEKDEGCLSLAEMMRYLDDLEKIFCRSKHASKHIPAQHFQKCVTRNMPPLQNPIASPPYIAIDEENKTIGGVNLLYFKWEISHQRTLENLAQLIRQNNNLLKKFSKMDEGN